MITYDASPAKVVAELVREARLCERTALRNAVQMPARDERLHSDYERGLMAGDRDSHRSMARRLRRLARDVADAPALDEWYGDLAFRRDDEEETNDDR